MPGIFPGEYRRYVKLKEWFELWKKEIRKDYKKAEYSGNYEDFYRNWHNNYIDYCAEAEESGIDYRQFIDDIQSLLK
ncbi:hypothetical protein ACFHWD_03815 [Clostridium sp. MT-14]|uniref:hypothetical protein n=1 Tax=Clostridium sp. MT-14 TaxID=3348360 RepID=UPI0035F26C91